VYDNQQPSLIYDIIDFEGSETIEKHILYELSRVHRVIVMETEGNSYY
jgi:hypothetical protein